MQEFHSNELEINFDFAENLKNLRIVDLYVNDTNNILGRYEDSRYKYKAGTVIREVLNVAKLKSCVVLYLEDSHVDDFSKVPSNILALSLRNSNFDNFKNLGHLNNLEYLDVSHTKMTSINELSNLKALRILNIFCTEFSETKELIKFCQEVLKLNDLEIMIIDKQNFNIILASDPTIINIKNKIIEVPNKHNIGMITSTNVVEMFKITERVKIQNDGLTYDFWNTPMGVNREEETCQVKIDYEGIKIMLRQNLIK